MLIVALCFGETEFDSLQVQQFSLRHSVQTGFLVEPTACSVANWGSFLKDKADGVES
jgi:hypothetical protein